LFIIGDGEEAVFLFLVSEGSFWREQRVAEVFLFLRDFSHHVFLKHCTYSEGRWQAGVSRGERVA